MRLAVHSCIMSSNKRRRQGKQPEDPTANRIMMNNPIVRGRNRGRNRPQAVIIAPALPPTASSSAQSVDRRTEPADNPMDVDIGVVVQVEPVDVRRRSSGTSV